MPMTNAERQRRYREKRKQELAALRNSETLSADAIMAMPQQDRCPLVADLLNQMIAAGEIGDWFPCDSKGVFVDNGESNRYALHSFKVTSGNVMLRNGTLGNPCYSVKTKVEDRKHEKRPPQRRSEARSRGGQGSSTTQNGEVMRQRGCQGVT